MNPADLVSAGLALVPVAPRAKCPTAPGWQRRENVVTKTSDLERLQGRNIGLAHAYCSPDPTAALDIDSYKAAKQWLAERGVNLDELLLAPDAVVIHSGKKYSLKLLYRLPPGVGAKASRRISGDKNSTILEFRCATKNGETVQDLLPPSIHPNGTQYEWYGAGSPPNLPLLPDLLLRIWNDLEVQTQVELRIRLQSPSQETPREVARLRRMLTFISADCDYQKWRNIVWAVLSTGWACAEQLAQEWSETAPERYDEEAFWLLINSYDRTHEHAHTVGSIVHFARLGGWNE